MEWSCNGMINAEKIVNVIGKLEKEAFFGDTINIQQQKYRTKNKTATTNNSKRRSTGNDGPKKPRKWTRRLHAKCNSLWLWNNNFHCLYSIRISGKHFCFWLLPIVVVYLFTFRVTRIQRQLDVNLDRISSGPIILHAQWINNSRKSFSARRTMLQRFGWKRRERKESENEKKLSHSECGTRTMIWYNWSYRLWDHRTKSPKRNGVDAKRKKFIIVEQIL